MMRMLWMSVRRGMSSVAPADHCPGTFPELDLQPADHRLGESFEQRQQVVRTGACLGVALEAERGPVGELDALQRAVEQRHMGGPHIGRQRGRIDREAM